MRTDLQYNLQKARALATELRSTLEEVGSPKAEEMSFYAGDIESWLDDMDPELIGEGHVQLKVSPNA